VSTVDFVAVESTVDFVESQHTTVESVVVVSVFSAPLPQEAKKIVADAKSMNVIFFIFVCLFFFVNYLFINTDVIYINLYCLFYKL